MSQPIDRFTTLSPEDGELLDALVETGFDPEALEPLSDERRRRVQRLLDLLSRLDAYPLQDGRPADEAVHAEALFDATFARIRRYDAQRARLGDLRPLPTTSQRDGVASRLPAAAAADSSLHPDDGRLLDALVNNGFAADGVADDDPDARARVERLAALLASLDAYQVDDLHEDDGLLERTMQRIRQHDRQQREHLRLDTAGEPFDPSLTRRRFILPEVVKIAAVLMLAASVLWPMFNYVREHPASSGGEGGEMRAEARADAAATRGTAVSNGPSALAGLDPDQWFTFGPDGDRTPARPLPWSPLNLDAWQAEAVIVPGRVIVLPGPNNHVIFVPDGGVSDVARPVVGNGYLVVPRNGSSSAPAPGPAIVQPASASSSQ